MDQVTLNRFWFWFGVLVFVDLVICAITASLTALTALTYQDHHIWGLNWDPDSASLKMRREQARRLQNGRKRRQISTRARISRFSRFSDSSDSSFSSRSALRLSSVSNISAPPVYSSPQLPQVLETLETLKIMSK